MKVIVECLKGRKEKYEKVMTPNGVDFLLNRMLKCRWVANYGYVAQTLQNDMDELDTYIIGRNVVIGGEYEVLPICMIYSIDNWELDNKLICATRSAKNINRTVKRIIKFVGKYKSNSFVAGVTWKDFNIRYELARTRAMYKLFNGGNK